MIAMQSKSPVLTEQLEFRKKAMDCVLHRVQNELSGSHTLMRLLSKEAFDSNYQKEAMRRMESSYKNLLDICTKYEAFSFVFDEPVEKRRVNLKHLFQEILKENEEFIKDKRADVNVDISGDLSIKTDERKLYVIFSGLLKNSCCYAHTGVNIRIWIETQSIHNVIHIQDDGFGISDDVKSGLFRGIVVDRIADDEIKLGFGLLTCHLLSKQLEGAIDIISTGKDGTHIRLTLPVNEEVM